jgi:hypothetical protein
MEMAQRPSIPRDTIRRMNFGAAEQPPQRLLSSRFILCVRGRGLKRSPVRVLA